MPKIEQIRNLLAAGERVDRDLTLQASAGNLDQVFLTHRHGYNADIDIVGQWTTMWNLPHQYPRVLAAGQISVASNSEADAITSAGAQKILITGCDQNGNPIMEIVELHGTSSVETVQEFFWVDFAHVVQTGSPYGGCDGDVLLTHTGDVGGDAPQVGLIQPEFNRTQNCIVIIPNEYSGYTLGTSFGTGSTNRSAQVGFRVSARNGVRQILSPLLISGGGPGQFNSPAPERIHYPSMVEMVINILVPNTAGFGGMTMLLINDRYDFTIPEDLLLEPAEQITEWLKKHPNIETGLAGVSQS